MFKLFGKLTHTELLHILPFECGYACDEEGEPCPTSLAIALTLQSIMALTNPIAFTTKGHVN